MRFEMEGAAAVEQKVSLRPGEKNRALAVSFPKVPVAAPPPRAPAPPSSPEREAPPRSIAPWILGGVGVAGLAVGGVLGGIMLHDHSVTSNQSQCSAAARMCSPAGLDAEKQGTSLRYPTTVSFVAGGLGVVGAVVWISRAVRPRGQPRRRRWGWAAR